MTKIVWSDGRNGASDIYAQNINANGQLGNTGVFISDNSVPVKYFLSQNYPNPFNPSTVIRYQIPVSGFVSLKIFDVLGNEMAELVNEKHNEGSYEIIFNAVNIPSGVYYYRLKSGYFNETKRMLFIK